MFNLKTALLQFEDFANHNAFELLAKYGTSHLVFNDDIQGTAVVILSGVVAALKLVGGTLDKHTFLFLGAGEAGTGIAELIALEISRKDSLQHFKKPWAHEHEPVKDLLHAVKAIKPTFLIRSSRVGRTFTKEVIEALASFNDFECTAEEAYTWTKGRANFASGSPFDPVEYDGKCYVPGQSNNAYIFLGLGLGLVISGAIRVHDEMLLDALESLAALVTRENFNRVLIYPPFAIIRKFFVHIAANVAAKAYELSVGTRLPRPENLIKYAESCMYNPLYKNYR
ncbi:NADP-dependent malic enzyme [Fagus crenata]